MIAIFHFVEHYCCGETGPWTLWGYSHLSLLTSLNSLTTKPIAGYWGRSCHYCFERIMWFYLKCSKCHIYGYRCAYMADTWCTWTHGHSHTHTHTTLMAHRINPERVRIKTRCYGDSLIPPCYKPILSSLNHTSTNSTSPLDIATSP